MKILSNVDIRAWEKLAFYSGTTEETLMQEAVEGCLQEFTRLFPKPGRAFFFCGKGNNGYDGLWLAGLLQDRGWKTSIYLSHPASPKTAPSSPWIKASLKNAVTWSETSKPSLEGSSCFIFDALLGSGASGQPRGTCAEMLEWIKESKRTRDYSVSIDIPSGLDPENGTACPTTFRADLTLCIGSIKPGLLKECAQTWVGRLRGIPLTLPSKKWESSANFFTFREATELTHLLPVHSYKHQRGQLAIWAGSPGMGGAAILAAGAALKAGAGMVRLYSHKDVCQTCTTVHPEVITTALENDEALPDSFYQANAWLIGPGLGLGKETQKQLSQILPKAPGPVLLDADALTLVAQGTSVLDSCPNTVLLTPHAGEFSRLMPDAPDGKLEACGEWLKEQPGTLLVYKGPNTLVAQSGYPPSYNGSGNPGMATAGMGDVLSGVIASLLAQKYNPWDAARLGVFWHGLAGDIAAGRSSEQCLCASDISLHLGEAWQALSA